MVKHHPEWRLLNSATEEDSVTLSKIMASDFSSFPEGKFIMVKHQFLHKIREPRQKNINEVNQRHMASTVLLIEHIQC